MRSIHRFPIRVLAALSLTAMFVSAADDTLTKRRIAAPEVLPKTTDERSRRMAQDPVYEGKPLSQWLKFIRQRDREMMPLAFEAIRGLGPAASPAVAELARVLTAPFSAIRAGKDSEEVIAAKLGEIQLRSAAIDALVWIGEAAAPAVVALVRWAVVVRVVGPVSSDAADYQDFVELMTVDIEQRMLVADAIVALGDAATPTVERLLRVPDDETRKLAIVILGGDALFIAADLLKSPECEDRKLAITILEDMQLIVAKEHLRGLTQSLVCDAD